MIKAQLAIAETTTEAGFPFTHCAALVIGLQHDGGLQLAASYKLYHIASSEAHVRQVHGAVAGPWDQHHGPAWWPAQPPLAAVWSQGALDWTPLGFERQASAGRLSGSASGVA
eukprot:CAMPEP_0174317480 /NCGR_PEP_ID=MMETSP0810-20121108/7604_1 /TAXON_ID=73025 ORGANISM="Eutreptiella gymnastica-like, Strain CCMP1594" /NCGR_SAMPLE_ID=MMETSP0810 /ASSEMBLY_ACC=CAM_ASM_000659 /LENGTH=112 /DNA_ID=CAMNT_0015427459 /DNA_START=1899 /DNA_END=2238 /DNA_ORIENTATION=+